MVERFSALVADKKDDQFSLNVKEMKFDDLPPGDVTIKVAYSSVNYKDGLATAPNGRIIKSYPFVPGIDLAGFVVSSDDQRYIEGDQVVVTGYGVGVSHYGGYSQYARIPSEWIVPLPQALTMKEAMILGTAGFTAALSIQRLEENGVFPEKGPVLVTGATGGVGSLAVSMLANLGYNVVASTGKELEYDYLRRLGAKEILNRHDVSPETISMLNKQRWAGAVDSVGGKTLAYVLSALKYGGSVAVSGLTGGTEIPATVFPFILRGVNLLGIDSVECPMDIRIGIWERLAHDLKPQQLWESKEVSLDELPEVLIDVQQGKAQGRTIVKL